MEESWDRRERLSPRRQARLSGKGLAVGLGGQSLASGRKIYAGGYMRRITSFIYKPKRKRVL